MLYLPEQTPSSLLGALPSHVCALLKLSDLGFFPSLWHLYVAFGVFFLLLPVVLSKDPSSTSPIVISEALLITGSFSWLQVQVVVKGCSG